MMSESGRVSSCDCCAAEGVRVTLSADGEAQVCDDCLTALAESGRPSTLLPSGRVSSCGDRDETQNDGVLVCDREAGHRGPHSCVIIREVRMRWLSAPARTLSDKDKNNG
jgi:hypothetical protein